MSFHNRFFLNVIIIVFCLDFFVVIRDANSQTNDIYGLKFASYEVKKDFRTSLNLTPDKPLDVKKSFTLSFNFKYFRNSRSYGYIVRFITNNSSNFDFISKTASLQDNDIEFVTGSLNTDIHYFLDEILKAPLQDWIHTIIHFDLEKNTISVNLNGIVRSDSFNLNEIHNIRIVFGANNLIRFSTSDVPPVIVKDIKFETGGNTKRYWKLDQYGTIPVIDTVGRTEAEVLNPVWVVDDHSKWKLRSTLQTRQNPQIAYNSQDSKIFIAEDDHLQVLNLLNDSVTTIKYKSGRPLTLRSNQLIYNPLRNELWQYIVNRPGIAKYNLTSNIWNNTENAHTEPGYWHHNRFFSPVDHRLMIFGGYGFYRYKNTVLGFNEKSGSWDEISVKGFIKPRYLSALGYSYRPDEILIFGGYGNESGKQDLSPENLYDLYSFNLKSSTFSKLWELKNVETGFALGNSLVVDSTQECFYALCYPVHKYSTNLFLSRFGISKPVMTVITDSIPYFFQDTESFCDLFYSSLTKELIAITSRYLENNKSEVSVYSLAFPPVKPDTSQLNKSKINTKEILWLLGILLVSFLALASVLFFLKKLKIDKLIDKKRLNSIDKPAHATNIDDSVYPSVSESMEAVADNKTASIPIGTIQLLGGFQVINKNGQDISGSFTPTLRQLFVMILLSSGEGGKGVPSELFKDNIWFKKSKESARNIRGVYIRKLRMILNKIGEINLVNTNSYWTIQIGTEVDYDYGRITYLLKSIRQNPDKVRDFFSDLIRLSSKGPMLPNLEYDWLDKHKADYSSEIIDVLLDYSKRLDLNKDFKLVIQIADSVFSNDPLNEEALRLKCKVLNDNGKHSLAKNVYESFSREYLNSMGSHFNRSFNDLVDQTPEI